MECGRAFFSIRTGVNAATFEWTAVFMGIFYGIISPWAHFMTCLAKGMAKMPGLIAAVPSPACVRIGIMAAAVVTVRAGTPTGRKVLIKRKLECQNNTETGNLQLQAIQGRTLYDSSLIFIRLGGIDSMIEIQRVHDVSLKLDVKTLKQVHLESISFHRCLLDNLDFSSSCLIEIDFRSAEMSSSKFSSSVFDKSKLIMVEAQNSDFDKCSFKESLLLHSDFSGSSFKYANLSESVINDVIFANCDLRGANFSCIGMETCVLDGAIYDDSTIWNENFNALEHGALKIQ